MINWMLSMVTFFNVGVNPKARLTICFRFLGKWRVVNFEYEKASPSINSRESGKIRVSRP
jgi:hypothetical protein